MIPNLVRRISSNNVCSAMSNAAERSNRTTSVTVVHHCRWIEVQSLLNGDGDKPTDELVEDGSC